MNPRPLLAVGIVCSALAFTSAFAIAISPVPVAKWLKAPLASLVLARGENPYPVHLVLPQAQDLSAVGRLGKQLFFDPALSGSGKLSCASCHNPAHAYAPANDLSVQFGGIAMREQGTRAVPSLEYLYRQPSFSIGPDDSEREGTNLKTLAIRAGFKPRETKTSQDPANSARNMVPQGGLFWDGRADTLQQQASGPLFNPLEMDGGTAARIAGKLQKSAYSDAFLQLFGPGIFRDPKLVVSEAMFAIARYEIEDPSFHPFTSKYDAWLRGRARLSPSEMRGYLAFTDPRRGNCAACHLAQPTRDGLPPLFTDMQFEALAVPRNSDIVRNRDPGYFDLGLCGPDRADLADQTQYCGMFLTPTLRNVATRHAFFHNGVYHSLEEVLRFYDFRDTEPHKIYPTTADGTVQIYNDLPARFQANVDRQDAPFNRRRADKPAMSAQDMKDIIAFLRTLTDGYAPAR